MNICVYCASAEPIEQAYLDLATDVGKRLAADGHGLVSGGGRVSMMGAVARAARAGGAHTVGVIPAHLVPYEVADTDADELIVVDTMRERKRVMDDRADAFLALPGGLGTLEELFEVWTAASLGMHAKPVAVLDPDGHYQPLWDYLDDLRVRGFVRPAALDALRRTTTVAKPSLPWPRSGASRGVSRRYEATSGISRGVARCRAAGTAAAARSRTRPAHRCGRDRGTSA